MKKVSIKTRVLIIASAIWFIYWLVQGLIERLREHVAGLYYMAVIPLVIFWGIYWIIQGIKEKRKERNNQKKDA